MSKHFFLFLTTALSLLPAIAQAQTYTPSNRTPQADNSIGTIVNPTGANNFNITGGLQRGQNLFHSFTDFSIPTGGAANFTNPAGNQSIISRVTGNLFSDLNGTLNTNGANFLLINPNGVVFGTGAQLNVGKAFVTSTASGVDLVDAQGRNYNFGVNKAGDAPLVSIDPNIAFNPARLIMNASIPGSKGIENYGTLETNNSGQYIGLIGGDIKIDRGRILAPGGRVDLGGLKSAGTVTTDSKGFVFSDNNLIRGDVVLTNLSYVNIEANGQLVPINTLFNNATGNGSSINISANNVQITSNLFDPIFKAGLFAGLGNNSGVQSLPVGDININAQGLIAIDRGKIENVIGRDANNEASGGGNIKIVSKLLNVTNGSAIDTQLVGKGTAGNIEITTQGNIAISGTNDPQAIGTSTSDNTSLIATHTYGQGDAGKISIETAGKLSVLNQGVISSTISDKASGDSKGVSIKAGELELNNSSSIGSATFGQGNSGNLDIETLGDLTVSGKSIITTTTFNPNNPQTQGNAANISLNSNNFKLIDSSISSATLRTGNAGNIGIKARGDITLSGTVPLKEQPINIFQCLITSGSSGLGNAGKISIDNPSGKLSLSFSGIGNAIGDPNIKNASGISLGITINARELEMKNRSYILSELFSGQGQAGNIDIKTTGDITITGNNKIFDPQKTLFNQSAISSSTRGMGDAGKISIDTQGKLSLDSSAYIISVVATDALGKSKGIKINAKELNLTNNSIISSGTFGNNSAGNIEISTQGAVNIVNHSSIQTTSVKGTGTLNVPGGNDLSFSFTGGGKAGNISISSERLNLDHGILASIANSDSGGNITLNLSDKLLLQNYGQISSSSGTSNDGGNGGNITINSPLIVALPPDNFGSNDITANAFTGKGGRVNITSQGLFGIQYRPTGSDFTNDITASSTFGQSGNVQINTPGVDPGKDTGELPAAPNDASRQISQTCSASQRDNKFYITGRGGLPPNASEPQESEALWQDAREVKHQPATTANQPAQLPPPAIGWVFEQNGRVRLIAAQTAVVPTETRVVCPGK
jgi:filamentous hemagglutinin family protein